MMCVYDVYDLHVRRACVVCDRCGSMMCMCDAYVRCVCMLCLYDVYDAHVFDAHVPCECMMCMIDADVRRVCCV